VIIIVFFIYRRFYYLVGYFLFLYNTVIGLFSVIKRVLLSLVIGTFLIARMDYVLLMRGFERLDSGQYTDGTGTCMVANRSLMLQPDDLII